MKYKVILTYTQVSRAEQIVEADSQAEAELVAEQIQSDELNSDGLNPVHGELAVESVEPVAT